MQEGHFEPQESMTWNDGRGVPLPLTCSECHTATLLVTVYDESNILIYCQNCGALWGVEFPHRGNP